MSVYEEVKVALTSETSSALKELKQNVRFDLICDEVKICPICGDSAPPDECFRAHYGGVCCWSCRAFFRRAHQRKVQTSYSCKGNDSCQLTPANKPFCKKCRYDKCIFVGMNPTNILTDEEKRVRFRKYFKKKDELRSSLSTTTTSSSASVKGQTPTKKDSSRTNVTRTEPRKILPKLVPIERSSSTLVGVETAQNFSNQTFNNEPLENLPHFNESISSAQLSNHQWTMLPVQTVFPMPGPTPVMISGSSAHAIISGSTCGMMPGSTNVVNSESMSGSSFQNFNPTFAPFIEIRSDPSCEKPSSSNFEQNIIPNSDSSTDSNIPYKLLFFTSPLSDSQSQVGAELQDANILRSDGNDSTETDLDVNMTSVELQKEGERRTDDIFKLQTVHRQVSNVLDSFAFATCKLDLECDAAQTLILMHQQLRPLDKTSLITQLSSVASALTQFALSKNAFASLNKEDQIFLLKNNIPLYLQYITARYFSAETGFDQLSWILEGQLLIGPTTDFKSSFYRLTLKDYSQQNNLFVTPEIVELYSHFCQNVGVFFPFPRRFNGLIASILLFHVPDSQKNCLKDSKKISCFYNEAKELANLGIDNLGKGSSPSSKRFQFKFDLETLIHSLTRMSHIFGTCTFQSQAGDLQRAPVPKLLVVNFTETENNWIKLRFSQIEKQFQSVIPPSSFLSEMFNLLGKGIAVSQKFSIDFMAIVVERARRVLKMHQEFQALTDTDQSLIWCKNFKCATALSVVRINLMKRGKDQVRNIIGVVDSRDRNWENRFSNSIDLDSLKCSYLHEPELNLGRMDQSSINCYFEILRELSEFCFNDHIYQLFILLTLLDTDGLPYSASLDEIIALRQTYLNFFQRKLKAAGCSFPDYASFRKALNKVKLFSVLMDMFMQ